MVMHRHTKLANLAAVAAGEKDTARVSSSGRGPHAVQGGRRGRRGRQGWAEEEEAREEEGGARRLARRSRPCGRRFGRNRDGEEEKRRVFFGKWKVRYIFAYLDSEVKLSGVMRTEAEGS